METVQQSDQKVWVRYGLLSTRWSSVEVWTSTFLCVFAYFHVWKFKKKTHYGTVTPVRPSLRTFVGPSVCPHTRLLQPSNWSDSKWERCFPSTEGSCNFTLSTPLLSTTDPLALLLKDSIPAFDFFFCLLIPFWSRCHLLRKCIQFSITDENFCTPEGRYWTSWQFISIFFRQSWQSSPPHEIFQRCPNEVLLSKKCS